MAIAIVGTPVVANGSAAATTLASPALSTTTGNSLLVGCLSQVGDYVSTTITGVTDTAGNTYTALTMQGSAGAGAQILRWFYCHNITGNASNVATGTWSASTSSRHIIQIQFSGAKNQAPISEGGNAVLGVSSCPVSVAMGSTVGAVFAMATSSNDRTWTPGTGFTEINDWGASAGAEYYTGFNATGTITADMVPTSATNVSLVAVGFEEATSGASGTLARTNANDTLAATGTTTVTGSLARTNVNDTSSATGTTTVIGSLAVTNANDTGAISGSVGEPVSGTLAVTNVNDTSAATGTTTILGTVAKTNVNDTSAAQGTTTVLSTAAITNANDTLSANGSIGSAVGGSLAVTNANDTSAATGTTTIVSSLTTTNLNDTSSASGTTTILGTLSITNSNDTLAASGTSGTPAAGIGTKLPLTGVGG